MDGNGITISSGRETVMASRSGHNQILLALRTGSGNDQTTLGAYMGAEDARKLANFLYQEADKIAR